MSALSPTLTTTTLLDGLNDRADGPAWSRFDTRYRCVLTGFARGLCLGLTEDDAAEAAQRALAEFARCFLAGKYERGRGRLSSWLIGIAHHAALDLVRERARAGRGGSAIMDAPDPARLTAVWERERELAILGQALAVLRDESGVHEETFRAFDLYALRGVPATVVAAECGVRVEEVYVIKNRLAKGWSSSMAFRWTASSPSGSPRPSRGGRAAPRRPDSLRQDRRRGPTRPRRGRHPPRPQDREHSGGRPGRGGRAAPDRLRPSLPRARLARPRHPRHRGGRVRRDTLLRLAPAGPARPGPHHGPLRHLLPGRGAQRGPDGGVTAPCGRNAAVAVLLAFTLWTAGRTGRSIKAKVAEVAAALTASRITAGRLLGAAGQVTEAEALFRPELKGTGADVTDPELGITSPAGACGPSGPSSSSTRPSRA